MLIALAAVAAASGAVPGTSPAAVSAPVAVRATATVRILSGVRLKLGSSNDGAPPPRDSVVRTSAGSAQPARLIEFQ